MMEAKKAIEALKQISQMCRNVLAKADGLLEQLESAPAPQRKKQTCFAEEVANTKAKILTTIRKPK